MADLSVNDFVSQSLQAGHPIEDIVAYMNNNSNPEYAGWANKWNTKSFGEDQPSAKDKMAEMESQYNKEQKNATTTNVLGFDLPSVLTGPASWLTGGVALGAAAVAGGKAALKGIQARSIKNPDVAEAVGNAAKVEATPVDYSVPAVQRKAAIQDAAGAPAPQPIQQTPVQKAQAIAERNRQAGIGVSPAAPAAPTPQSAIPPQAPAAPAVPTTVSEAVATGQSPSQAIQANLAQDIDATVPTGSKIGRPLGAKNLTPAQREMVKAGETVAGGRNWLLNQFGGDAAAYEQFIKQFNQGADYPNYKTAVASLSENLGGPSKSDYLAASKGKPAGTMKAVAPPEAPQSQKGSISPSAALNIAGNALGAYGLMQAYKEGKNTGDWSNLGLGSIGQVLANVAPRAGLAFSLMQPGTLNKNEEDQLAKMHYMQQVGSGRGIAPPSAYAR